MEKVHVENDWYDGPRCGIADFNGVPHRFLSQFKEYDAGFNVDLDRDVFHVFPITLRELDLEKEQWGIFVSWNRKYEAGESHVDCHPAKGGVDSRWDEIEEILSPGRNNIPDNAMEVYAVFLSIDNSERYGSSGPSYGVIWEVLRGNA